MNQALHALGIAQQVHRDRAVVRRALKRGETSLEAALRDPATASMYVGDLLACLPARRGQGGQGKQITRHTVAARKLTTLAQVSLTRRCRELTDRQIAVLVAGWDDMLARRHARAA